MSAPLPAASQPSRLTSRSGGSPLVARLRRVFVTSRLPALVALVVLPLGFGVYVLGDNATRDWSYHWRPAQTLLPSASPPGFVAGKASTGFDVLSGAGSGSLRLSRFGADGGRLGQDVLLSGSPSSSPGSLAVARAGTLDVAAWRQDSGSGGGGSLQIAAVRPGSAPIYATEADGGSPLEHVQAFPVGGDVAVVFSWLRSTNDAYLVRVRANGAAGTPVRLTHASVYAFDPHGAADGLGTFRLVYLDQCCGASGFRVMTARYSVSGRQLGPAVMLDEIASAPALVGTTTPAEWGLDVQRLGDRIWAAWMGHGGLKVASWAGPRMVLAPQTAVPGGVTPELALALDPGHEELVWQTPGAASDLLYQRLDATGSPVGTVDRATFESGFLSLPQAVTTGDSATLLYASAASVAGNAQVEARQFSAMSLSAPDLWARLGFGLTNPLAAIATLLFGALALGILLALANILFLLVLAGFYLLVARFTPERGRWLAYSVLIALILYIVVVLMGAPTPPLLAINSIAAGPFAYLLFLAIALFAYLLQWVALRRTDELLRGGLMATAALYFLGFLQALTVVQGELGKM